jgi:pheromone alpha factor receptor
MIISSRTTSPFLPAMSSTDPPSTDHFLNKSAVYDQYFAIIDRHGQQSQFPLWYVDTLIKDAVVHGIIPGVQFGASLILFLVLVLLSKHDKRRSPVFIFNTAALFFNIIYALLQCCIVSSSWWDIYPIMVGDYGVVTPAAQRLTVAVSVFVTLVALCIEASLVLQIHVVSVTMRTWQRLSILAFSSFVAAVAIGLRIAQSVVSVMCNNRADEFCSSTTWLAKAKDISLTLSTCFFSAIFCAKLGWSLRERRKLGMKQFGSMQIIFIGGFQTMFIPGMFRPSIYSSCTMTDSLQQSFPSSSSSTRRVFLTSGRTS